MIEFFRNVRSKFLRPPAENATGDHPPEADEPVDPRGPRPRIGIALSSGGAKGLAHIGVIQVLEENGIEVDIIAGASMGAYVGALWAAGYSGAQLEELAAEMKSRKNFLKLADPAFPPSQGFLHGRKVKEHLEKSLGKRSFRTLKKELYIVATNLNTLERKIFSEGDVATAVHASIAIPGVCVPVEIDGKFYSDGGICDPLPVGVLHRAGADHVIAVSTLPRPEDLADNQKMRFAMADLPPRNIFKRFGQTINREINIFAKGNMVDILRTAAYGSQIRLADQVGRRADVLLRAVLCEGRWHDYSNYEAYIRLGRDLAEAEINRIKALALPKAAA